ncbi:MAG: hypothetical protein HN929_00420 [Chloroflexi bacterium]|nr:hypothetical protein [Chloroflexota bacterium]
MAIIMHSMHKLSAMGAIIRFSHLLREARLEAVFNPKKPVSIQTPYVNRILLFRSEKTFAFSSTRMDANTKTHAEKTLAMRKRVGSILYLPPHARCPIGNPVASNS